MGAYCDDARQSMGLGSCKNGHLLSLESVNTSCKNLPGLQAFVEVFEGLMHASSCQRHVT